MTQNLKGVIIADPEREIHSLERTNAKLLGACQKVLDDCAKYAKVQIPAETFAQLTAAVSKAEGR